MRLAAIATGVVLLVGSAALSWRFMALRLQFPPESAGRLAVASFVEAHTPPDALVGVEDVDVLFYAHRRGWPVGTDTEALISKPRVAAAFGEGVAYLAVGDNARVSAEALAYLDAGSTVVARSDRQTIWRVNGK